MSFVSEHTILVILEVLAGLTLLPLLFLFTSLGRAALITDV